jgi:hypothetical protein
MSHSKPEDVQMSDGQRFFYAALEVDTGSRRREPRQRRPWRLAAVMAAVLLLLGIDAPARADTITWTALLDQTSGTTYSLRGVALSANDSTVYGTWLHTGDNKLIVEYNATTGALLYSSTIGVNNQAKSIATDDRGYVYLGSGDYTKPTQIQVRSSDLQTIYGTASTTNTDTTNTDTKDKRIGGASIWKNGNQYYLYITRESGFDAAYIQRFNVTNPSNPTLDTSFGSGGTLNLQSLLPGDTAVGYLRGLEVAKDGTIYVTSTRTDTAANKANARVYKIAPNLTSATYTTLRGAMDVAIYGSDLYVSQYDAQNSAVAVLNAGTLGLEKTLLTGFIHSNTSADSGYSGIDITSDGRIFLADQVYSLTGNSDRLLESSSVGPVPIPSTVLLLGSGLMGLLLWRRRSIQN